MTDEPVPPDVLPPKGMTADTIRALNRAQHQTISITVPGDVLTDPEGLPVGMTEPRTVTGTLAARISGADIDRSGLTREDVPNVRITD